MSVRHFTAASSEKITLSLGALGFAFGPGTIAAIVRPATLSLQIAVSAGATNAVSYMLSVPNAGTGKVGLILNNTATVSLTSIVANQWYLAAATKATGTVAPRFHIYDYSAVTWVHENSASTIANSSVPITRGQIGSTPAGAGLANNDIAAAGVWNVELTDLQVESLLLFNPVVPAKGLWSLNQDVTGGTLADISGGGANQSAIVGTSVTAVTQPVGMFNLAPPKPYEPGVGVYGVQAVSRAASF